MPTKTLGTIDRTTKVTVAKRTKVTGGSSQKLNKYNIKRTTARIMDVLNAQPKGVSVTANFVAKHMTDIDRYEVSDVLFDLARNRKVVGYIQTDMSTGRNRRMFAAHGKYRIA